jgi:DNA-binding transcriptional LysR family regulator
MAPFARDEIVVVCAPAHPWASSAEVGFDEFLREPLIIQQQGAGIRAVVEAALRERGVKPTQLNVFLELGLNESVKHAVMAGAGVTYLSKFAVRTDVRNGMLATVRVAGFQITRDFWIVRSRTRALSKAVEAFLHFLEAQYERL